MTPKELREQGYASMHARNKERGRDFSCNKKKPPTKPIKDLRRTPLAVVDNPLPCIHLGPAIPNQTCGCKSKLRKCAIFDTCTTGEKRSGIACCHGCEEFRTRDSIDDVRRHMLYFVYPIKGNGMWQHNIRNLKKHADLFNGRRVISIAISPGAKKHELDPPEMVREFAGGEFEFIYVSQYAAKRLGEVTAFPQLLRTVHQYQSPVDYTFYGHAKGVLSSNRTPATKVWGDLMYEINLSNWASVEEALRLHSIVGAFRCGPSQFPWHFSGTFFWFRNADVFAHPTWDEVPQRYGGTEIWPSTVFPYEKSACLFGDNEGGPRLYASHVIQEMKEKWEAGQS